MKKKMSEDVRRKLAIKKLVGAGYGTEFKGARLLNFKTEEMQPKALIPAIKQIKGYNQFAGEDVAKALKSVSKDVSGASFGRESSPVLYLGVPMWTHHKGGYKKGTPQRRLNLFEKQEIVKKVKAKFKGTKPDEFDVENYEGEPYKMRLWWD